MPPVPDRQSSTEQRQSSQLSSFSEDSTINSSTSGPFADPASLLRVIPLANYAPTARVAQHIAPHTVAYPPSYPTGQLYAQHQAAFQAMDHPKTQQDWELRQESERRIAGFLRNGGGGGGYGVGVQAPNLAPSHPSSSSYPSYSVQQQQQQQQHSGQPPPPLPYSFLPAYLPPPPAAATSTSTADPCPSAPGSGGSGAPSTFFEDLVSRALARTAPPPPPPAPVPVVSTSKGPTEPPRQVSATPTISRQISGLALNTGDSPDPLGLMSPSPTKRRKASHTSHTQTRMPYPTDTSTSTLSTKSLPAARPAIPAEGGHRPHKRSPQLVVEIPLRSASSASSQASRARKEEEEEEEQGIDWGGDEGDDADQDWDMEKEERASPVKRAQTGTPTVRTGERDTRSVRQKFLTLLEDIFEAADSLPAEPDLDSLHNNPFFDRLSTDGSTVLLKTEAIERITRYVVRLNNAKQSGAEKVAIWDEESLKRVFRLLERSMRDAEHTDPFPNDKKAVEAKVKKEKGKKGKKVKAEGSSQEVESMESAHSTEMGGEEVREAEKRLSAAAASMRAVECCLACLDTEGLSKPLYSEDLISLCVGQIKQHLSSIIFPVIEGMAGDKSNSRYLSHLITTESSSRKSKSLKLSPFFAHSSLSSIAQSASSAFQHLSALISRPDLSFSDTLVIQTVYLATAPLFVTEPTTRKAGSKDKGGSKGEGGVMKALRMEALGCLRGAFAKYSDQRQWIIEEILSSLIKLPDQKAQARFQLGDGSSLNTLTALLLQLIQASSHGVSARISKLKRDAAELEASGKVGAKEEARAEEIRLCQEAIDAAYRTAQVVAGYLIQKSSSSKASKTTSDTDYKAMLDKFIEDILASLYRPEWPAAALFLSVFSKLMIAAVEDTASSAEATATRNMALDHLGSIAARLKGLALAEAAEPMASLEQIISSPDANTLQPLLQAHQAVHTFLVTSSREDSMYASADDLSSILWAQELQAAIDRSGSVVAKLAAERTDEALKVKVELEAVNVAFRAAADTMWLDEDDIFGSSDPKQSENVIAAATSIARHRPLQTAFEPILHALLGSMGLSAVGLRAKALKGLSTIVQVDPDVLALGSVRQAFEARLSDPSPAVREPAVDLVGKYMLQKPSLAEEYYPHIALRVNDTGLAVRKKVIKLLRDIFAKSDSKKMRTDICCKMVEMIADDDHNIRDMAVKGLAEMLHAGSTASSRQESAALLVDIIGHYQGQQQTLEDALQKVAEADKAGGGTERSEELVEALIQRLIDATEEAEFDAVSHIRAISFLCGSKPDIIGPHRAAVLLNYLRPPANADEQASNDLLLRIFRLSISSMPRTASTFASELTTKLTPMISRPSGGFGSLKEVIGAFCAVTTHLTKDYGKLIQILRACEARLQNMDAQYRANGKISQPPQAVSMMLYIVALLAEHCNLDQVAVEDHFVKMELVKISERPLFEHLFDLFLDFTQFNMPQVAPTTCIGCLTRTYPSLVLRDETHAFMDRVFASSDFDNQARLFGVMHEFLVSEAKRKLTGAGASKDMDALIGSAPELSESGVSTAIVQRNIQHILDGTKSHHVPTQTAALDVLAFTVNQGLYHPLQCMPILISLETHEDPLVSSRALELHATLHRKHSTLVNVRYLDFARASFEYQRGMSSEVSGHRREEALLSGWFGLIGEKRAWKLDFLKALCRAYDYDSSRTTSLDVGLALYLSENLATFEYKQQEEVMVVIQQLSTVVSTCTPLVSTLESARVAGEPGDAIEGKDAVVGVSEGQQETVKANKLINASLIVALALLTKNHLLSLYSLTEDKCLKQATVKKSVFGDRAATRKGSPILELGKIPLVRCVETVQAFHEQQAMFLSMIHDDGSIEG